MALAPHEWRALDHRQRQQSSLASARLLRHRQPLRVREQAQVRHRPCDAPDLRIDVSDLHQPGRSNAPAPTHVPLRPAVQASRSSWSRSEALPDFRTSLASLREWHVGSKSLASGRGSPLKESHAQTSRASRSASRRCIIRMVLPPVYTPVSTKSPGSPARSTLSARAMVQSCRVVLAADGSSPRGKWERASTSRRSVHARAWKARNEAGERSSHSAGGSTSGSGWMQRLVLLWRCGTNPPSLGAPHTPGSGRARALEAEAPSAGIGAVGKARTQSR